MARKLQDREKLRHLKGKVKGCNGFMSPNKMELGRLGGYNFAVYVNEINVSLGIGVKINSARKLDVTNK